MSFYFIYNNLKVNPFILQDAPPLGFELLAWENDCHTPGTLWDIGVDAGLTSIGLGEVYGQIWKSLSYSNERDLEDLFKRDGLFQPTEIKVLIEDIPPILVEAKTFQLKTIVADYAIVHDGKWTIKRSKLVK